MITCVRKCSLLFFSNDWKSNLFLTVLLIINQKWFRQWLGTEKTISHYPSNWWSRPMAHIWVSRIDWVDYFTVLGKYIHAEKNGTLWAHDGCFHPHIWKWAIPTPQVGWVHARDGLTIFCKIPSDPWRDNWQQISVLLSFSDNRLDLCATQRVWPREVLTCCALCHYKLCRRQLHIYCFLVCSWYCSQLRNRLQQYHGVVFGILFTSKPIYVVIILKYWLLYHITVHWWHHLETWSSCHNAMHFSSR